MAAGLLEALGVRKAIVVGHSAGAVTAVELFRRYIVIFCHCLTDMKQHPAMQWPLWQLPSIG